MHAVIIAVVIVAITGLFLGIVLSVASVVMKVPVDETAVEIEENLAGANCGACGYPGCDGFAAAVVKGEAPINGCAPAGEKGMKGFPITLVSAGLMAVAFMGFNGLV